MTNSKDQKARMTKGEKILVALTAIFLVLLIAKSLWVDGYHHAKDYDPALLRQVEQKLELQGGIVSDKVLSIRQKEQSYGVHTRRYLFYVFPIGEDYLEVVLP